MATRAPYMRLVGDHAPEELEGSQELELMAAKAEQAHDDAQPAQERAPRKRKRAAVPAAPAESTAEASETANERPDGQVVDATDDASDENNAASDVAVDHAALEALLFSTHHPLTAGRLGEMLELDSTKPIRTAIKQLNEQYELSGRSFRIEQVAG